MIQYKSMRDVTLPCHTLINARSPIVCCHRSHFGGPAVEGMRPVVLADPLDACEPLRNNDSTSRCTNLGDVVAFCCTDENKRK